MFFSGLKMDQKLGFIVNSESGLFENKPEFLPVLPSPSPANQLPWRSPVSPL